MSPQHSKARHSTWKTKRNWGDASWKAYAPLPYQYKHVTKGDSRTETVTITVGGANEGKMPPQDPVQMKLGEEIENARIPMLVAPPAKQTPGYTDINFSRAKHTDAEHLEWSYIPTTHLPDVDTIMENLPAVAFQARTVRSWNPKCTLRVAPIDLSNAGVKDPRDNTPIEAAWTGGMIMARCRWGSG